MDAHHRGWGWGPWREGWHAGSAVHAVRGRRRRSARAVGWQRRRRRLRLLCRLRTERRLLHCGSTSATGSGPGSRSVNCILEHSLPHASTFEGVSHGRPCRPAAAGQWAVAAQQALVGQGQVQQRLPRVAQLAQAGLELEAGRAQQPCWALPQPWARLSWRSPCQPSCAASAPQHTERHCLQVCVDSHKAEPTAHPAY